MAIHHKPSTRRRTDNTVEILSPAALGTLDFINGTSGTITVLVYTETPGLRLIVKIYKGSPPAAPEPPNALAVEEKASVVGENSYEFSNIPMPQGTMPDDRLTIKAWLIDDPTVDATQTVFAAFP